MVEADWFRPRGYPHFDAPLGRRAFDRVEKLVSNPAQVARHPFLPFISFDETKYKIQQDEETGCRYRAEKGTRTLSYASHLDSQIYSFYCSKLSVKYEAELHRLGLFENVTAYRKLKDLKTGRNKSNIHFALDAFNAVRMAGNCQVYAFDIKSFFDSLNPEKLKQVWARLLGSERLPADHYNIFKSLTAHCFVDRDKLLSRLQLPNDPSHSSSRRLCDIETFRKVVRNGETGECGKRNKRPGLIIVKSKGIPQGSPISGLLANLYMIDVDFMMQKQIGSLGGGYFRYSDDVFCLLPSNVVFDVEFFLQSILSTVDLNLNRAKTEKSVFSLSGRRLTCDVPYQYLGFRFDGTAISLRASSIARYRRRAKAAIALARNTWAKNNRDNLVKGIPSTPLFRKSLFENFSHTGQSNFITYGLKAWEITGSTTIRRQIKNLSKFFDIEIARPL